MTCFSLFFPEEKKPVCVCVCPGVTPRSGWAVDPFGHSPSMTYILKGAGLEDMVIQRVHYAVKKHFAKQQTLEFAWRQSWGEDLTHRTEPVLVRRFRFATGTTAIDNRDAPIQGLSNLLVLII